MWIEHSGVKLPYNVARAEGQAIQWFEGLAEVNQPEQNQQGFGYHSTPSYIDNPLEYSQWDGGAGLLYEEPGATSTRRYSASCTRSRARPPRAATRTRSTSTSATATGRTRARRGWRAPT
jgi:hypothetical protein